MVKHSDLKEHRLLNSQHAFANFFRAATSFPPYGWQTVVASEGFPEILSVPTGLGKTAGATDLRDQLAVGAHTECARGGWGISAATKVVGRA